MFGAIAVIALAGELLFLYANAIAFGSLLQSLRWSSRFLTDWTGLFIAAVCAAVAWSQRISSIGYWLALATVAAVLVGTMFALLGGWAGLLSHGIASIPALSSLLAHVMVPWALLAAWVVCIDHGLLRWRDAVRFMMFPLAYLTHMFARGLLGEGFPYPEVDVTRVGWGGALIFAGATTLLFLTLGCLLVWIDHRLGRRRIDRTRTAGAR